MESTGFAHTISERKVKNRILNDIETEQGWYGQ
jgi:hypothetical protein